MHATEPRTAHSPSLDAASVRRLAVTWRHPRSRRYHAVGLLEQSESGFRFAYLSGADRVLGTRLLLGFSELTKVYESERLFPLFAERLMDPARPERPMLLEALSLDALATPMELLARSGGRRAGDAIELLPEPSVDDAGRTDCLFLVHGVRHVPGADSAISRLERGQPLALSADPANAVNERAIVVATDGSIPLGWVPDPLVSYVQHVIDRGGWTLSVARANGPELGPHLRLLVHLQGTVAPDFRPFGGQGWQLASGNA